MPDAPRSAVNSLAPGIPLWRKLGIREGWRVALVGAPEGFEVENLPAGVEIRRSARGSADLTVWFVPSRAALERQIVSMAPRARSSGLWIAWPKRASPLASDLTDEVVRRAGIDHGLVDFKVCAIDSDWSGLRFNLLVTHLTRSDERGTT
ncbi:MAG: DUF3052 domain-containing protein [Acidimicrobiales bacterium]|jgi:hypothetical protein